MQEKQFLNQPATWKDNWLVVIVLNARDKQFLSQKVASMVLG